MSHLRFAFRQVIKNPAFSAVAIITLALGIGANTAIFSIVNAVLLRPLPYPDADRIMVLNESSGPGQDYSVALPDYFDWQNDNKVFEHLACTHKESRNLSGIPGREAERVSCASVTRNFFDVIGLPTEIGRTFSEEEDKVGGPPVVLLSDRLWQRAFNRDPGAIGRSINLHDQSYTIVGVMPPQMTSPQDTDAWFSLGRRSNNPAWMDRSHHPMMFVWGRLKAGVTVEQARTEMKGIAARLEKTYPDTNTKVYAVVTPLLENLVGKYRTNLGLLLGAVGLVLLIACANLANLFAARGAARARDLAIHAAVGATRWQIIRQLLIESFVIALIGGALGFCMAVWVRDALIALSPGDISRFQQISFDLPVLGFTFLIASLTTILFGLWPAWQASHADVQLALKSGSAGSGDPPSAKRARDWLVISEIALTLTLLVAAGLVLKSFSRMQALQLGYEPRGLFSARLELPWKTYSGREKIGTFTKALLDKVSALPGVQNAGIGSNSPLMGGWQTGFYREGAPPSSPSNMPSADLEVITGDYFATFKAPLLRGRTFNERDTKDSPRVIIIDQAMAEQFFPGEDPIGKRLSVDAGNDDAAAGDLLFNGSGAADQPRSVRSLKYERSVTCQIDSGHGQFDRSIAARVRRAANDRPGPRNLGHTTSAQFSFLDLCRPRASARDHRSLRPARLHNAQARPRNRDPSRPWRSASSDSRARTFARDASAFDRLGNRFARCLCALARAPKRAFRSEGDRPENLFRSRAAAFWSDHSRFLDSGAARFPRRSHHRLTHGVNV